jgi:hypothetical protein
VLCCRNVARQGIAILESLQAGSRPVVPSQS